MVKKIKDIIIDVILFGVVVYNFNLLADYGSDVVIHVLIICGAITIYVINEIHKQKIK